MRTVFFIFEVNPLVNPRPGLSQSGERRAGDCRQLRFQLVFRHERHLRTGLEFSFAVPVHQRFGRSRLWFSVALPLGINGKGMGGVGKGLRLSYPLGRAEDCGAQKQRQLRASAAGGFGPPNPKGRENTAIFSAAASGERRRSDSGVFRPSASGGCGPTVDTGT